MSNGNNGNPGNGSEEKKYTQAQFDKAMADKANEYDRKWQAKLNEAQQDFEKQLSEAKAEALKKGEERAKMSAEEKAKADYQDKVNDLKKSQDDLEKEREQINQDKALTATKKLLQDQNLPVEFAERLSDVDEEKRMANVKSFAETFNKSIEAAVQKKTQGSHNPQNGNNPVKTDGLTQEQFNQMGVEERSEVFKEDPDLYHKFRKGEK